MNGYEFIDTRRGYNIYRKIRDGRGVWRAVRTDSCGNEIGAPFRITYDQALGLAPIDDIEALGMHLGKLLMPYRFG